MSSGYRWDAADYAKSSSAQQSWARELMAKLGLRETESVLDIGCGDGKVTAEIARLVPRGRVVGVDSSAEMIATARAAWPAAPGLPLEFQVMDARALTFAHAFDAAFSNAALHWVHDQAAVLSGVARALKPGGRLLFQMGGRGNGAAVFAVADALAASPRWSSFFEGFAFPWSFLGPEEYRALCEAAGLTVQRVELLPKEMRQQGAPGLAAWIRTTWLPYLERLPAERRDEFVQEAVDRCLRGRPLAADGAAVVDMVRLEVEARRPN